MREQEQRPDEFWSIVGQLDRSEVDPTFWSWRKSVAVLLGVFGGLIGLLVGVRVHTGFGVAGFVLWLATATWVFKSRPMAAPRLYDKAADRWEKRRGTR